MFESDKKSPLDRLKKGLYSRNTADAEPIRHSVHGDSLNVPESWDPPAAIDPNDPNGPREPGVPEQATLAPQRRYAYKIIFACSALFLLAAVGIAAYTFLSGGNFVSVDNVDITIVGPAAVAGGSPLSLDVTVSNKNDTGIQLVDLIAQYPSGTKDPNNPSKDLTEQRISLGDIASGAIAQQTVSALIYGQEGDAKQIQFTAEYRTADSNAVFYKDKAYQVTISSSPVIVSIDSLSQVTSGAPFDATVSVSSNTTNTVRNLLMTLDTPSGFAVDSAAPAAAYNGDVWDIGDLGPGQKRTIVLHAVATGEDGEAKTIHANIGVTSPANTHQIGTNIVTADHTFTIAKPFLGLDLALNGERADLSAQPGRNVTVDALWTNNSSSQITNATLTVQLGGNVLDQNSVIVQNGGTYNSQNDTITWQPGQDADLSSIAPGANGRVSFTLSSKDIGQSGSVGAPEITISVSAQGSRIDETGAPESINTAVSRAIKLVSNLSLTARSLYSQGPFRNSGPVPPKVGQSTSYTVAWTVTNTTNTITGAQAIASLPPYMSWTGNVSPADAAVSYSTTTGMVTWAIGDIPASAASDTGARTVYFQVSFTPSANQVGTEPAILGPAAIGGTDAFTGARLQNQSVGLSTRTSTDLLYKTGDEIVQQ